MSTTISPQTALIYTMVLTSAADGNMTDQELATMGDVIRMLPVFTGYDMAQLTAAAEDCASMLQQEEGLDTVLGLVGEALSPALRETAYALACDVAAADGRAGQEELRLLEIVRHNFDLDRLVAAAIERGVRARHATR